MASWLSTLSLAIIYLQIVRAGYAPPYPLSSCRYLPGDVEWPSPQDWANLNLTIEGRLIQTVPLGTPCHDPTFDAAACSQLQASWPFPVAHCDPYSPKSSPCLVGNYPDYSIKVSSWKDAAAGIKFAKKKNIRLVIKNTGHDYLGKSTGKGSLSLWTHHLKSIQFLNYSSKFFTGKAVKIGAGVQGADLFEAANAQNAIVLGGNCPSIGLAGGYTQGGGHSILSSLYGLGADQVLEWEVVTAQGQHLTATPKQNQDLYWALSGGGGGTYGVVISLIIRTHPPSIVGGAVLGFASAGISNDTYWDAIAYWQSLQEQLVDAGTTTLALAFPGGFQITPFNAPDASVDQTTELLAPFTNYLTAHKITFSLNVTSLPFIEHYQKYFGVSYPVAQFTGGRLIPRSVVKDNNAGLTSTFRRIVEDSPYALAIIPLNVGHPTQKKPVAPNAVLPAWRDALFEVVILAAWNYTASLSAGFEQQSVLTNVVEPALKAVTPGSGTYLNEGDFQDPDWKEDFYGRNYGPLRAIKAKYDHDDLFYATTAVGSDAWSVALDGRLCRTKSAAE